MIRIPFHKFTLELEISPQNQLKSIAIATRPKSMVTPDVFWSAFIEYYFNQPLDQTGWAKLDTSAMTAFQRQVYEACCLTSVGKKTSYSELAEAMGTPTKARAVGGALGRNPFPLIIPCHRVLAKDGGLCGFAFGVEVKRELLQLEN